jgi:hypothetical protein
LLQFIKADPLPGVIPVLADCPWFTSCFQHAVLATLPALFFWLCFPAVVFQTRRQMTKKAKNLQ